MSRRESDATVGKQEAYFFGDCLEAAACCFFLEASFFSDCFWVAFLLVAFGDLSPMVVSFCCCVSGAAA